jgi:hypothetical protein
MLGCRRLGGNLWSGILPRCYSSHRMVFELFNEYVWSYMHATRLCLSRPYDLEGYLPPETWDLYPSQYTTSTRLYAIYYKYQTVSAWARRIRPSQQSTRRLGPGRLGLVSLAEAVMFLKISKKLFPKLNKKCIIKKS